MRNEKLERTIYELKQLLEVTKVLNSTLNFTKLVDSILFTFMAQARCVKAALYIGKTLDPNIISLQRNYMGFDMTQDILIQIDTSIRAVVKVAKYKKCLTPAEFIPLIVELEPGLKKYIEKHVELLIPLIIDNKLIGLVFLGGRIDSINIEDEELNFLSEVGIYSSIALQNAILFDMATIDLMTGLKVKQFLTKFMEECIKVEDHKFIIFMMDIDNFKKVNDTYGHQIGDEAIIAVADEILSAIRTQDVACRFGGEEFVLLLREANIDAATLVAERILKNVESLNINTPIGDLKITISIGVSEFDSGIDKTPKDVIGRADAAMYASKRNGKNQITFA